MIPMRSIVEQLWYNDFSPSDAVPDAEAYASRFSPNVYASSIGVSLIFLFSLVKFTNPCFFSP